VADGLDATGRSSARLTASAGLPGGGALDVQGTARATPMAAEVRTRITRVDLAFWAPYFSLPVEFTGMAETDLTLDTTPAGPRVRGRALMKGVTVSDGTRRLAAADQLELTGLDAQWPKTKVERVRLSRPRARIGRDRDGRLTIAELVESMKKPAGESAAAAPVDKPTPLPPDFAIEVGEVSVEDGRLRLDDATVEPAAVFRLTPIRFTARSLTWPSRGPATLQLSAGTPEGGTIETQGTVVLDPVRFDLRTRLVNIAVAPYRAYAPLAAKVEGHVEGDVTAKGTVGGGKTELSAKGSLALADLAFIDGDRPILTVGRLEMAGLDYTWPATATIDRVHMRKSWALLERRPERLDADHRRPHPAAPRTASWRAGAHASGGAIAAGIAAAWGVTDHDVVAVPRDQGDRARGALRRRWRHRGGCGGESRRAARGERGAAQRPRLHVAGAGAGAGAARGADPGRGPHHRPRHARPGREEPPDAADPGRGGPRAGPALSAGAWAAHRAGQRRPSRSRPRSSPSASRRAAPRRSRTWPWAMRASR